MIKMTLKDGTEVEFTGMNGDNFIAPEEMDTDIFTHENLQEGRIECEDGVTEFKNWEFMQQLEWPTGEYYLSFCERTAQDILNEEVEDLIVQLAEIEVEAGTLLLEDIPGSLQDEVRVKIDDDKWIDK